jgi:DNA repair protein RadC
VSRPEKLLQVRCTVGKTTKQIEQGINPVEPVTVKDAALVARFCQRIWPEHLALSEHFIVLFVNARLEVIAWKAIGSGGQKSTCLDIRQAVIISCTLAQCHGIIFVHNHPSGSLKPSQADMTLTREAASLFHFLNKELYDHVILVPNGGYFSMAQERMLPSPVRLQAIEGGSK